ncbi:MAG: prepilin peptidase [Puniceicoccales bacterium]|jgi:prepilin signal peptidase PulO-like enzyme (type II secretory pathway)|nr:prepilin peptidase [Puniceicoccales bacterium]
MLAFCVVVLWGFFLDFIEWCSLRNAILSPMRGASAAGIFRGHFHGSAVGPWWRGLRTVIQPSIFALVFCFAGGFAAVASLTLLSILFAAARADIAGGAIPPGLIFIGLFAGPIFAALRVGLPILPLDSVAMGAVFASVENGLLATASLFWLAIIFEAISRREGLGFGDVQLAGVVGLFLGYGGVIYVFFFAAIFALITYFFQIFFSQRRGRMVPGRPFPFVPFILAGTIFHYFLGFRVA